MPVWRNPRVRKRQRLLPEDVIAQMAQAGSFGIERNHRDHAPLRIAPTLTASRQGIGTAEFDPPTTTAPASLNRIGETRPTPTSRRGRAREHRGGAAVKASSTTFSFATTTTLTSSWTPSHEK